ncbi:hypothetical protein ACLB2K_008161 [Fragaria x ananassa]
MASKASPSASANRSEPHQDPLMKGTEETALSRDQKEISLIIDSLQKQVISNRGVSIKKRIEENRQKLAAVTNNFYNLSLERRNNSLLNPGISVDLLTKRQQDAFKLQNGDESNGSNDSSQEDGHGSTAVLLESNVAVKNAVRPIKLPEVKRLPPYTTWVFLDRNQRMTEDQSILGRRRIYYDQNGGEALICSDSEEEAIDEEEEKREFVESEDYILRMTIKEAGVSDPVLESLAHYFSRSPAEVKARYEALIKEEESMGISKNTDDEDLSKNDNSFLDKDLDAALDSFDNLFCRRCLVFDCRLHGCSQDLVFPAEKHAPRSPPDDENLPCGPNCCRLLQKSEGTVSSPMNDDLEEKGSKKSSGLSRKKGKSFQSESASSNAKNISESSDSENETRQDDTCSHDPISSKTKVAGKSGTPKRNSKRVAERVLVCMQKRQKKTMASDSDSIVDGGLCASDMKLRSNSCKDNEDTSSSSQKNLKSSISGRSRRDSPLKDSNKVVQGEVVDGSLNEMITDPPATSSDDNLRKEEHVDENIYKQECSDDKTWKTIETSLFEKGIEIFGKNSCLIARNLLNGMKTCWEVFQYMNYSDSKVSCQAGDAANSLVEGYSKGNNEARRRSKFLRRKGRVRRLKYTWKSAAYHSIRKRITDKKDQPCRQYNPCTCQTACGKQCSCLLNGTCCEKYCGCPKSCKNRFRGCHCAKSQCRSRQCPCFAADRECDPDVCRNCWVSCGDGSLGVPNQRGDNYECRNMKLLLKQQQRVLLGRSDVSGWGAFLKNSVSKHEYLGEYTGELISHREADKRGKIYDRENSSFLFNLNDQFVLDAYRKGDKLKFANHSPDPNCYAKVIMVAGDHRVGIFAKERIASGEELFYDYRYEPDRAPAWARKPEASGSKRDDAAPSSGRAKKVA